MRRVIGLAALIGRPESFFPGRFAEGIGIGLGEFQRNAVHWQGFERE
jgi:hypothetical protein